MARRFDAVIASVQLHWVGHRMRAEIALTVDETLNVVQAHAIAVQAQHHGSTTTSPPGSITGLGDRPTSANELGGATFRVRSVVGPNP